MFEKVYYRQVGRVEILTIWHWDGLVSKVVILDSALLHRGFDKKIEIGCRSFCLRDTYGKNTALCVSFRKLVVWFGFG